MNILLDKSMTAKVSDFGLVKLRETISGEMNNMMTASVGTPLWMAPEVTLGQDYGPSCDVYSFAMIMYELLSEQLVSVYSTLFLPRLLFSPCSSFLAILNSCSHPLPHTHAHAHTALFR